jgi:hypothetical protein
MGTRRLITVEIIACDLRYAVAVKWLATIALFALACGSPTPNTPHVSREPISVRGWIVDVESPPSAYRTIETEWARKSQLFLQTNIWVDNAPYVSGGVAENGSFILLDVPPGNVTVSFSAPGAPLVRLVLEHVPGNADVFIPALFIKHDSVALLEPKGVKVRLAAKVKQPTPTGATAIVAGLTFPVVNTPMVAMMDRLDYPIPPSGPVPIATVK